MRLASALPLAALAAALPIQARADCAPPLAGFAICEGADADGFDGEAEPDGLVLEIRPGASVTSPGDAVALGEGARVLNQGSVEGGDEAITAGAGLTVENDGAIEGADDGIDVDGSDGLTVLNLGVIAAGGKAITAGDGAGATLENEGVVEAGSEGFEAGDDATLINLGGGRIVAGEDAVQLGRGAFVGNDGLIEALAGDEGDGIDLDDGTILNTGTIRAADGAGIDFDGEGPGGEPVADALIDNAGLIEGAIGIQVEMGSAEDAANLAAQTVFNEGTIRGTSGVAIDLGAGDDLVVAVLGGEIDGDTLLGEGDDLLLFHRDEQQVVQSMFGLLDGGAGEDQVAFNNFDSAGLSGRAVEGGFALTLTQGASSLSATLLGFESFAFDDATLTAEDVAAVAPIPLPAGLPLLAAGLGGLTLLRRRARG